jgi:hypothetical protein
VGFRPRRPVRAVQQRAPKPCKPRCGVAKGPRLTFRPLLRQHQGPMRAFIVTAGDPAPGPGLRVSGRTLLTCTSARPPGERPALATCTKATGYPANGPTPPDLPVRTIPRATAEKSAAACLNLPALAACIRATGHASSRPPPYLHQGPPAGNPASLQCRKLESRRAKPVGHPSNFWARSCIVGTGDSVPGAQLPGYQTPASGGRRSFARTTGYPTNGPALATCTRATRPLKLAPQGSADIDGAPIMAPVECHGN